MPEQLTVWDLPEPPPPEPLPEIGPEGPLPGQPLLVWWDGIWRQATVTTGLFCRLLPRSGGAVFQVEFEWRGGTRRQVETPDDQGLFWVLPGELPKRPDMQGYPGLS